MTKSWLNPITQDCYIMFYRLFFKVCMLKLLYARYLNSSRTQAAFLQSMMVNGKWVSHGRVVYEWNRNRLFKMKSQGANKASIIHECRFTPDHRQARPRGPSNKLASMQTVSKSIFVSQSMQLKRPRIGYHIGRN